MDRPFRLGLHFWEIPVDDWRDRVQRYESLGFSTITLTDHIVVPQWEPFSGLSAIAAVTDHIGIGTLVLDTALRNPVLVAKAAATIHRISGGRFELGLGAGYVVANFQGAGVSFESAPVRLARLEEAATLVRELWTKSSTTMHGRFYDIADSPMVAPEPVQPRLLIGGGGKLAMGVAGRLADTVSVIPRQHTGEWSTTNSMPDSTATRMAEKVAWARDAAADAGRDPDALELNTMVFRVIVGDDPRAAIAAEAANTGISPEQMADSSLYLCGTGAEVCDWLIKWRERTGISYLSLFDPGQEQVEYLAQHVLQPLTPAR
jgi:probable F420-dependent oxidoreductase